jgi:two-component system, NtrC family, response regulator AtoC
MYPELDSPALAAAASIARQLATTRTVPVLILGERGSPSEELARLIHAASGEAPDRRWVAVHCRGVPEGVIESELFGDPDGKVAIPPAVDRVRPGTLFIESVPDLGLSAQARLAAFIEGERDAGETALGGPVRVVATASADVRNAVRRRTFRAELLERLSVMTIAVPPLRTRVPDIIRLALLYARDCGRAAGKEITALSPEATAKLIGYPYPGNERELRAIIERAVIVEPTSILGVHSVSFGAEGSGSDLFPGYSPARFAQEHGRPATLSHVERAYIAWMLNYTEGNRTAASRLLGISYPTIMKKITDYRIDLPAPVRGRSQ